METLIKKIVSIQGALKAPKNQYNNFGKYKYRSCEDILEAVKPLLVKEGLLLTISDDLVMMGNRIYVKAIATITDGKNQISNVAFAREEEAKKGMDGSQVTGASSSYARKYALNGMFCIDDAKDSDATNQGGSQNQVLEQIKQASSKEELAKIYNENKDLHENTEFMSALSARKKDVK